MNIDECFTKNILLINYIPLFIKVKSWKADRINFKLKSKFFTSNIFHKNFNKMRNVEKRKYFNILSKEDELQTALPQQKNSKDNPNLIS